MTPKQAATAIAAILESLEDKQLPKPDKVEQKDDGATPVVWFGGHGYHLGSTRNGWGEALVGNYRRDGISQMFEMERVHRMEAKVCAERAARAQAVTG